MYVLRAKLCSFWFKKKNLNHNNKDASRYKLSVFRSLKELLRVSHLKNLKYLTREEIIKFVKSIIIFFIFKLYFGYYFYCNREILV